MLNVGELPKAGLLLLSKLLGYGVGGMIRETIGLQGSECIAACHHDLRKVEPLTANRGVTNDI